MSRDECGCEEYHGFTRDYPSWLGAQAARGRKWPARPRATLHDASTWGLYPNRCTYEGHAIMKRLRESWNRKKRCGKTRYFDTKEAHAILWREWYLIWKQHEILAEHQLWSSCFPLRI